MNAEELFHGLDARIRRLLPLLLTLCLVFFDAVPKRAPDFAAIAPILPLAGIYYWAIFRPELLGPKRTFLLGVIYDLAIGAPVGVFAAVFLLMGALARTQRRFFNRKPFAVIWLGFALMMVGAVITQWALTSAIYGKALPMESGVFSGIMTVCAYPVVSWSFARLQQAVMRRA